MRQAHKQALRNSPIKTWADSSKLIRVKLLTRVGHSSIYSVQPLPYIPKDVRNDLIAIMAK